MKKIVEISSCTKCESFLSERIITSDSWERPEKWTCKKKKGLVIDGYHDIFDADPGIPEECPLETVKE